VKPELSLQLQRWLQAPTRIAAATVVEVEGSTPHPLGMALLSNERGEVVGAVSGGCVDGVIIEACDEVLRSGRPKSLKFNESSGLFESPGLICGGSVTIWVYELPLQVARQIASGDPNLVIQLRGTRTNGPHEVLSLTPEVQRPGKPSLTGTAEMTFTEQSAQNGFVLIVGQSGFTTALIRQAELLGHEVALCEPRKRFATVPTPATAIIPTWPDQAIEALSHKLNADSAIVVCTHESKFDEPALIAALKTECGFICALGSRRTASDRVKRLISKGVPATQMNRIYSPAGLDLNGVTPAETALSIFAQWVALKNGGSGRQLTEMSGPIHGSSNA